MRLWAVKENLSLFLTFYKLNIENPPKKGIDALIDNIHVKMHVTSFDQESLYFIRSIGLYKYVKTICMMMATL